MALTEYLTDGNTLGENAAVETAKVVGQIRGLDQILEMKWEDIND